VSLSETIVRLDSITSYTKPCPKSHKTFCKNKACENELDFLKAKYVELLDNSRVGLYGESEINLVRPDLEILVVKAEHRSLIL